MCMCGKGEVRRRGNKREETNAPSMCACPFMTIFFFFGGGVC